MKINKIANERYKVYLGCNPNVENTHTYVCTHNGRKQYLNYFRVELQVMFFLFLFTILFILYFLTILFSLNFYNDVFNLLS